MSLSRRQFLGRVASLTVAAGSFSLPNVMGRAAFAQNADRPQTPFEAAGKSRWTTEEEEWGFFDFLRADTGVRNRFHFEQIGTTEQLQLPIHLFAFGTDDSGDIAEPASRPTVYVLCTQHGNEPAGREAGIELIRDLAYTDDPALSELLTKATILITPTANPDGRARNARENGITDINRDHLNLRTVEAQAFAAVGNQWKPYMIVDHHEYGPSLPPVYDDDILYLWPRNLNVDAELQAAAKAFCLDYIKADSEAAGYSADEYGLYKLGPNVGPLFLPAGMPTGLQMAGDWDDGIARNAGGLRNTMGILVESAVSARAYDASETPNNMFRRVESQRVVMDATLRHLAEQGEEGHAIAAGAAVRRAEAGAAQGPVYFDGQDEPHPSTNPASLQPQTVDDPGAVEYRLPAAALDQPEGNTGTLTGVLGLHEVDWTIDGDEAVFSMAQPAKNVIPLLLDSRGKRSTADATPAY
jgi:predicted deacylase